MDDALTLVREFDISVGPVKTKAHLGYITNDPYAVILTVPHEKGSIMWVFARELLKGGGEGDVKITHGLTVTCVELSNSKEKATLIFDRREIEAFTRMMFAMVKDGEEERRIDWDRELSRLID